MNKTRQTGKFIILLLLLSLSAITGGPAVRAQEPTNYLMYLPAIFKPAFVYLPIVYRPEPPRWMGPDGGSIVCLAVDPTNTNILYAGTSGAGVYKTTNGGIDWFRANLGILNESVISLTVDPISTLTLYAGTQGHGIFKTTNGGETWAAANQGIHANSVVYTLAVNPGNNALVFAGTRIENTFYDGVLYKSNNGGESWEPVLTHSNDWVYSVAINPNQSNIILVATHEHGPFISEDYGRAGDWHAASISAGEWSRGRAVAFDPRGWKSGAYYGAWHGNFYRSSNNGASWDESDEGLSFAHVYPNGISIKPGDPNILYLASHNSGGDNDGGVFRSGDSGASWAQTGLYGKTVYSVATGSGNMVFAGTYQDGLFKSTNGGSNWYRDMSGLVNTQVTGLVFPDGVTIFASTEGGGISKSSDKGQTWAEFNNNLNDRYINGLVLHPDNPNILFALTSSAGLRRYDLSANTGWGVPNGFPSGAAEAQLASKPASPFYRIEPIDDFLEVERLSPPTFPPIEKNITMANIGINGMEFDPSNAEIAYLATNGDGVYKSLNSSASNASWSRVGLDSTVVWKIAASASNPGLLYAATNQNGLVKRSSDGGFTWENLPLPDASLAVNNVAIWTGGSQESLYAGTSNGVWKYNGASWEPAGLQGSYITVLVVDPFTMGILYAGTNAGAFYAANPGYWIPFDAETSSTAIQSINFNLSDPSHIYFGTTARGTLRLHLQN